jgi:eukaryotic-like serine/threonine-protein kinase
VARPAHLPGAEAAPGYEVIEHLSRGRRLDVYDAWSAERGCRCIIKAIRPERAGEDRARELLLEEGRLLERLTHPHLVRAYETLLEPVPAIVMETLSGATVGHMIATGSRATSPELGQLALQLGSAIRYLHANGVLHLDLKPSNVVAEAGRAKLIDLSVARPPGPAPAGVGTPDYMAPEQARGADLGPAADVWGVGVVLFEAATGEPAFALEPTADGDSQSGAEASESWSDAGTDESWSRGTGPEPDERYAQLEARAELLAGRPEIAHPLAELIDDCLDPDPAKRPTVASLLARSESVAQVPPPERRWS